MQGDPIRKESERLRGRPGLLFPLAGGGVLTGSTLNPESKWTYTMVEEIQRLLLAGFKAVDKKVDMWGHSAGGQFTHRFSFFGPNAPVRYFIPANAGYYTTPELSGSGACA